MKVYLRSITIILLLTFVWSSNVWAKGLSKSQLGFDVAMDRSTLPADKKETAYLRVALKGFEMESDKDRPPVNIAIVIDKSGSMSGEKIEKAKDAAIMAISRLNPKDIISVITYDTTINILVPATKVSDKELIYEAIQKINAGGNTALFAGVSKGAAEMRKFISNDYVNRLVLLSDGLANVGPSTPTELGDLGASLVKEGISVTTIGLGLGYNEDLMTKLAFKSDGSTYFAEKASDLAKTFDSEFGRALSIVAQEVKTTIRCDEGIRPVRILGREGTIYGNNVSVFINHIYSEKEKVIVLEVEVPPTSEGTSRKIAEVYVNYNNMKTNARDELSSTVAAHFSSSNKLIEKGTNANVMVNVVNLIAVEKNVLAMRLRDEGKVAEAKKVLTDNSMYLNDNASRYNSEKLRQYGTQQQIDASNLDEANWNKNRKNMQQTQNWEVYQ